MVGFLPLQLGPLLIGNAPVQKQVSCCWPCLCFCSHLSSPVQMRFNNKKRKTKNLPEKTFLQTQHRHSFPCVSLMPNCLNSSWQKKYLNHTFYKTENLMTKQFSRDIFSANNIYYSKHCKVRVERLNKRGDID